MEFLDEYESRPRFLFQSKNLPQSDQTDNHSSSSSYLSSLHKPTLFISVSFSLVILNLTFFYFNSEPLKSILLWLSFSLFLGPFAPPSLTAGDISVGIGPLLKDPTNNIPLETNEKPSRKSSKPVKKQPEDPVRFDEKSKGSNGSLVDNGSSSRINGSVLSEEKCEGEREWSEVDDELLRKLMGKHPVGKPGRWEAIAEGYKGRFKVESVIAKAKEMGDRRKVSDQDSYNKFLKDRKAVDQRVIEEIENQEKVWSNVEDLALLNAIKAFPKDVAMRWEKIAASVPGKTKAACVKRVAELKKDFRSSKAAAT